MNKKRSTQILELVTKHKQIEVTQLAKELNVSQVTMRKDLDELEKQGIISRKHGFAQIRSSDDINGRIAYHYENKREIAIKATELINDGETLMIENGSCCALFAGELTKTKENLTIITNSAFIANYIRHKANFEIILLGGLYQKESQVLVGPMIKQYLENFYVDKIFIGTDGYTSLTSFTNSNQMRAQATKDMASHANNIIILTESEKFLNRGITPLNLDEKIKMVITDSNIEDQYINELNNKNIEVIKA